jgi:hypothetical protein
VGVSTPVWSNIAVKSLEFSLGGADPKGGLAPCVVKPIVGSPGAEAPGKRNPQSAIPWVNFAPWGSSGGCLFPRRRLKNATDRYGWTHKVFFAYAKT